jgi:hypothetical protein
MEDELQHAVNTAEKNALEFCMSLSVKKQNTWPVQVKIIFGTKFASITKQTHQ